MRPLGAAYYIGGLHGHELLCLGGSPTICSAAGSDIVLDHIYAFIYMHIHTYTCGYTHTYTYISLMRTGGLPGIDGVPAHSSRDHVGFDQTAAPLWRCRFIVVKRD